MTSPDILPETPNDPELFNAFLGHAQDLVEQKGSPFYLGFSKAVAAGEIAPLDVDKQLKCFDAYPDKPKEIYGADIGSWQLKYSSPYAIESEYTDLCNIVEVGKAASGDTIVLANMEGNNTRSYNAWLFNEEYRERFGMYGEVGIDFTDYNPTLRQHTGTGDPFIYWIRLNGLILMRHYFDTESPRRKVEDFELDILLDAFEATKSA